jgi:hypothetical protein
MIQEIAIVDTPIGHRDHAGSGCVFESPRAESRVRIPLGRHGARLPRFLRVRHPRERHQGPGDHGDFRVVEVVLGEAPDEEAHDRGHGRGLARGRARRRAAGLWSRRSISAR